MFESIKIKWAKRIMRRALKGQCYKREKYRTFIAMCILEIMPGLEEVHVVNTDPPYNLNKEYGYRNKKTRSKINDDLKPKEYWEWFGVVFNEINKKLKNGYLYCSHSD